MDRQDREVQVDQQAQVEEWFAKRALLTGDGINERTNERTRTGKWKEAIKSLKTNCSSRSQSRREYSFNYYYRKLQLTHKTTTSTATTTTSTPA